MRSLRKSCRAALVGGWAVLLAGCAGTAVRDVLKVDPDDLHGAVLAFSTPHDQVLWHMHAGLALFEQGDLANARRSLEIAYQVIDTIFADNPDARRARGLWNAESVKPFRGEPYERAAVGYYLGLLDMAAGDYENARAAFRWGMFQDTQAADASFQADMASLLYLRAWASMCSPASADRPNEDLMEFQRLRPQDLPPDPRHNLLVLGETGLAPVKIGLGRYAEYLSYQRGGALAQRIEVAAAGGGGVLRPLEDLYWQASTLGGREVDKILADKASFKDELEETSEDMASVAMTSTNLAAVSAAAGQREEAAALGAVALLSALGSVASTVAAENVRPAADTRAWTNLPDTIHAATLPVKALPSSVRIRFLRPDGKAYHEAEAPVRSAGRCGFAWAKDTRSDGAVRAAFDTAVALRQEELRLAAERAKMKAAGVPSF